MKSPSWRERSGCPLPDIPDQIDWCDKSTTIDQAAIEETLGGLITPSARILHVGIGNSSLARAFARRCARIEGFSISQHELAFARSLALPNYHVDRIDKYAAAYDLRRGDFSLVIDNNPNSYACCWDHFITLLEGYRTVLGPQGHFMTHERGLLWARRGLDPAIWSLDGKRFEALAFAAGFVNVEHLPNGTYLVSRGTNS